MSTKQFIEVYQRTSKSAGKHTLYPPTSFPVSKPKRKTRITNILWQTSNTCSSNSLKQNKILIWCPPRNIDEIDMKSIMQLCLYIRSGRQTRKQAYIRVLKHRKISQTHGTGGLHSTIYLHIFNWRTKLAKLLCLKYLGRISRANVAWSWTRNPVPFYRNNQNL